MHTNRGYKKKRTAVRHPGAWHFPITLFTVPIAAALAVYAFFAAIGGQPLFRPEPAGHPHANLPA